MPQPRITGVELIRLLEADGWVVKRRDRHGYWLSKVIAGRRRFTTVKPTREETPSETLGQILGPRQTVLGTGGLNRLIKQYG